VSRVETPAPVFVGRTFRAVLSRREEAMAAPEIYPGRSAAVEIERGDCVHASDRMPDPTDDFMHAKSELVG
jgi:hypothetical protein